MITCSFPNRKVLLVALLEWMERKLKIASSWVWGVTNSKIRLKARHRAKSLSYPNDSVSLSRSVCQLTVPNLSNLQPLLSLHQIPCNIRHHKSKPPISPLCHNHWEKNLWKQPTVTPRQHFIRKAMGIWSVNGPTLPLLPRKKRRQVSKGIRLWLPSLSWFLKCKPRHQSQC